MDGEHLLTDLLQRCTFPVAGTAVVCAVSGGADSVAMLLLAVEANCDVTAVHVDHGIRAGSATEADFVAEVAAANGCAFRSLRVTVEPGSNLEARARQARYGVLPDNALLGHTADDQAETVLLHMLRGAGPTGLAGMRTDARRPILHLRRAETEAVCRAAGIEPFVDPTNNDTNLRRNRIRHQVLPLLDDVAERDIVPLLVRQADQHRQIETLLDELADGIDPTDVVSLRSATPIVARTALRRWLCREAAASYGPDTASIDRVLAVVDGSVVAAEVAGFGRVSRSMGRLSFSTLAPDETP